MKKPVVDYRKFRLSKINTSQFSHLKLLISWIGYFAMYILTENLIPVEKCHVVHCTVDDIIPFCEWFVIPYVFWYGLVAFSLVYFLLYNIDGFKKLQTFIIITQVVAMTIYVLYPNCQNLRPVEFPRNNALTDCVGFLYSIDTNTGVCPSLHCAYSIAIASVFLKEKTVSRGWKAFIFLAVALICLSTVFIKQHSVVDFLVALPICMLAEIIVFKILWPNKKQRRD